MYLIKFIKYIFTRDFIIILQHNVLLERNKILSLFKTNKVVLHGKHKIFLATSFNIIIDLLLLLCFVKLVDFNLS